jgi:uncharacterized protein YjbJ (UPF0337 family)
MYRSSKQPDLPVCGFRNAPEISGAFSFDSTLAISSSNFACICASAGNDGANCRVFNVTNHTEELVMDKDRVAGGVKKVTGKIKEQAGKALGDTQTEAEGKADQAEGRVQGAVGHAKDAVREIVGKK